MTLLITLLFAPAAAGSQASEAAKDANGVLAHSVRSEYQAGETKIRVLLPDAPGKGHAVLYVLPVEAKDERRWGDGLLEVKRHDLHNRHGLVVVAPTFSHLPWYADHPTDPAIRQESYFLKVVLPFVEKTYPVRAERDARLLLGFSKSGCGAWSLLLRHPEIFGRAAAWDSPLWMDKHTPYGAGSIFGTRENFELYRPAALLRKHPKLEGRRLIHLGYGNFRDDHLAMQALLEGLKVPRDFRDGPGRKHEWESGWVPQAVELLAAPGPRSHFPDPFHGFVWRNWTLVPTARLAEVAGATPDEVLAAGRSMGLPDPPAIGDDLRRRSYITVIRRNWHLLPDDQLLRLLEWTREKLDFTLREDDFLGIKLGPKPACEPVKAAPPAGRAIAAVVREEFPDGLLPADPPFEFVRRLSAPAPAAAPVESRFSPRFCHSYFALYGDPLLEPETDPYPDGYLARLAASGVDGVWLQGVLFQLSPFPWEPARSARHEERRKSLRALVERARTHGIGVYLYLNEPRAMPVAWYEGRADLRGVVEGGHAALCTSHPDVRKWLDASVESLCRAVPGLAGLFTITASENLTNCWSHAKGDGCPRCSKRTDAEVIADVNVAVQEGIARSGAGTRLIAWDWGWRDAAAIDRLPPAALFMSVSEWDVPIERGGVKSAVGEYSISAIGPGPRALRHWDLARKRGLKTVAKIQAANTWELSAVPYIPAVQNTALHVEAIRKAGVDGLMLGWTLGGYPSPNLEVVAEMGRPGAPGPDDAMLRVARRRHGEAAPAVVAAWKTASEAFREFPYHVGTVYRAPLQVGPANPLWESPTGMASTMVGFPYDDLDGWRAVYPAGTWAAQLEKVADGFDRAAAGIVAVPDEWRVTSACAIHFRSCANQARFVLARGALARAKDPAVAAPLLAELERVLRSEIDLAKRLHAIQSADSRIGFEASNHYYYVGVDLAEKVLNCRDLLDRWLAAERRKW